MLVNFEPVEHAGHTYDIRVVNAPLETFMLRRELHRGPRGSTGVMLAAVFLLDYEFILQSWERGVHAVAFEDTAYGRVCTCGLVTGDTPIHALGGHLDPWTWNLAEKVVLALPTSSS